MLEYLDRVSANLLSGTGNDAIERLALENTRKRDAASEELKL